MKTFQQHLTESSHTTKAVKALRQSAANRRGAKDKDDLEIIADDLESGDINGAGRYTGKLDTEVRDAVSNIIVKNLPKALSDQFHKAAGLRRLR